MTTYQYRIGGAPKGYQRYVRYSTVGTWECPEIDALRDESGHYFGDKHETCHTGSLRVERMGDDYEDAADPDGAIIRTITAMQRRFKVTKGGPRPRCKCGRDMTWLGYRIACRDETVGGETVLAGLGTIRDGTKDRRRWIRFAKTLKQRDAIVQRAVHGKG